MNYTAVNTKIKSMYSNLLSKRDYEFLCNSLSVLELGNRLKKYESYKSYISSLEKVKRTPIEQRIIVAIHNDYKRLYNFSLNFKTRKFLDAYFLKYEIHIIKTLICMIYDERDNLKAYDIGDLENNLSIDINKLKSSSSISIFIDNLRGTEFFPVLSKIYKKNISPFTLEVQLDLYYYLHLWKQKNKYLSHKDKIIAKKIIGSDIDMRNIIWLYRLKKYYNLTGNNVYSYLIPIHYKLSPSYIKELTEQSSYNMKYKLLKTLYGDLFADDFHKDSIESTFIAKKLKLYRYYFWNHHDSIAVLLAYIYFKEVELNNIISLTEGVRYGLAPESIMSLIHNNVRIER